MALRKTTASRKIQVGVARRALPGTGSPLLRREIVRLGCRARSPIPGARLQWQAGRGREHPKTQSKRLRSRSERIGNPSSTRPRGKSFTAVAKRIHEFLHGPQEYQQQKRVDEKPEALVLAAFEQSAQADHPGNVESHQDEYDSAIALRLAQTANQSWLATLLARATTPYSGPFDDTSYFCIDMSLMPNEPIFC